VNWHARPVSDVEVTTIWADGEVYRTDRFGDTKQLKSTVPAHAEFDPMLEPVEL
jgi:hypothetical protein